MAGLLNPMIPLEGSGARSKTNGRTTRRLNMPGHYDGPLRHAQSGE